MTFFITSNTPTLRIRSAGLTWARIHHLLLWINHDLEEVRTTDRIETSHVWTLNSCEVFAAHRERHMTCNAINLAMGISLRSHFCLNLVAVLASLTDCRTCNAGGPVVASDFMRIMASYAAHTFFVVLRHEQLSTFSTARRARRFRLRIKGSF